MPTHFSTSRPGHSAIAAARFVLLALLAIGCCSHADDRSSSVTVQPGLQLSAASHFETRRGQSSNFSTIGLHASIERAHRASNFSSGLFVDLELGSQPASGLMQVTGGWASFNRGHWKLATSAAYFSSEQQSGLWLHASTLQFEVRPGHKLAVSTIGVFGSSRLPATQLVYKTRLGRASIALNLGLGSTRPHDIGASTKFTWEIY